MQSSSTTTDSTSTDEDPLRLVLPEAADRLAWSCTGRAVARDTGATVFAYEHRVLGRALRLDAQARVYGQDVEGAVRLFGRGGALALAVALNAVYDGGDEHRPARVTLPGEQHDPAAAS